MNSLLGKMPCDDRPEPKFALRSPPWVQVCILAYYTSEQDKWGSRKYRIFDTKLVVTD